MRFSPKPNEVIRLFDQDFTFLSHANASGMLAGMLLSWEGSRAFVYKVKDVRGKAFALKVFKPLFRDKRIAESQASLKKLEALRGMSAAERRIVRPGDQAAKQYSDLKYAVLMPWIAGETWDQILIQASKAGPPYDKQVAIRRCSDFLETLSQLEGRAIAHTDISSSNVVFQTGKQATELLDLEDVYMPGVKKPAQTNIGTPNYQHPASQPTWCPQGDRYAAAVLASEILLLTDKMASKRAAETGYFAGNCTSPEARMRFDDAQNWFKREAPQFGDLFNVTWRADSLEHCPPISDFRAAVAKMPAGATVRVFTPTAPPETEIDLAADDEPGDESFSAPAAPPDVPTQAAPPVSWEPFHAAPKKPSFEWVQPPPATAPPPAQRPKATARKAQPAAPLKTSPPPRPPVLQTPPESGTPIVSALLGVMIVLLLIWWLVSHFAH